MALSDSRANQAGSYRYTPYGENSPSSGSSTTEADSNPIRFTGQYLDSDSGLYYMRAREYDPESGRFLEVDPMEQEADDSDLSSYLYAEDDPTLLTDPSGLDPSFGGRTLNCKKNVDLCKLLYIAGYKDGCGHRCLRKALTNADRAFGVEFAHIDDSIAHKGKVVFWIDSFYFVRYGSSTIKLKPPQDESCGWICSFGFLATQVYGCDSLLSCEVNNALFFMPIPLTKAVRLMKARPKLMKAFNIFRRGKRAERATKVAAAAERTEAAVENSFARVDDVWKGLKRGKNPRIREVESKQKLDQVYEELTRGGQPTRWKDYPGKVVRLADGIDIGIRPGSKSGGAAIDIRTPGRAMRTIHIR